MRKRSDGSPELLGKCEGCGAEAHAVSCLACRRKVYAPIDRCVCGTKCTAWGKPGKDGLPCPRCRGSLWRVQLDVSAVHVEQCSQCLGCFARTEDYSELIAREEAGGEHALRKFVPIARGKELPRQTLLAMVSCPHCRREMDRVRFADRASLIVDVCAAHGIWLDAGELLGVLDFVRERRRSGAVPMGPVEKAEQEKWSREAAMRANEARVLDHHASRAERLARGGDDVGSVVAATALGGPWLGLFVALRNRNRRP